MTSRPPPAPGPQPGPALPPPADPGHPWSRRVTRRQLVWGLAAAIALALVGQIALAGGTAVIGLGSCFGAMLAFEWVVRLVEARQPAPGPDVDEH